MKSLEQTFTTRQYMLNPHFEFFHYKDTPELEVEYHNHDFYEIYFLISGKVTYVIEGKYYRLRPGDIMLINNKELHRPIIEEGCIYERIVIWLDPGFIKSRSTDGTDLSMCFETISRNKYNLLRPGSEMLNTIKGILYRLNNAAAGISYGSNILKDLYLTELIVYLNKAFIETYNDEIEEDIIYDRKVNDIIFYINRHLDENLSLEALSSRFYTSKYHLLREFKKHTGHTLHSYIHRKRLITAKQLLSEGNRVTDVCQSCGFGDYSNFIRAFRRAYGMSPKKFSNSNKIQL